MTRSRLPRMAEAVVTARRVWLAGMVATGMWLAVPGPASTAEQDLDLGLAYLRAGAQQQAVEALTRYRNEERNPDIRKSVDQVLPLLANPLPENVRQYIAKNLEARARATLSKHGASARPSYWARMFPVLP